MSKVKYRLYGIIRNGVKKYYNPNLYNTVMAELEGKEFEEVTIEKHKAVSSDHHGFYRAGIVGECAKAEMFGGWTREEIHKMFADMFLSYVITEKRIKDGKTIYVEKVEKESTSGINSKEMAEFCEKCIQWCAENGIIIHDPEDYKLGKYQTREIWTE